MKATSAIPQVRTPFSLSPRAVGLVGLLAVGLAAAMTAHLVFDFDSRWVWRVGYPALFVLGVIGSVAMVLPIPILPLVFAGGTLLDPYGVAMSAAAGMTVGMGLSYFMGSLGHGRMSHLLQNSENRWARWGRTARSHYERRTVISSFLIAAIPNPVYSYSGIITGSMRVSVGRFCLGTFLGKTIQATVVALAGFYAGSLPLF